MFSTTILNNVIIYNHEIIIFWQLIQFRIVCKLVMQESLSIVHQWTGHSIFGITSFLCDSSISWLKRVAYFGWMWWLGLMPCSCSCRWWFSSCHAYVFQSSFFLCSSVTPQGRGVQWVTALDSTNFTFFNCRISSIRNLCTFVSIISGCPSKMKIRRMIVNSIETINGFRWNDLQK